MNSTDCLSTFTLIVEENEVELWESCLWEIVDDPSSAGPAMLSKREVINGQPKWTRGNYIIESRGLEQDRNHALHARRKKVENLGNIYYLIAPVVSLPEIAEIIGQMMIDTTKIRCEL